MKYYIWLVCLVAALIIFGCGQQNNLLYYPLSHYTQMTLDQADKKVVYLDWGEVLVYNGKMQTNTEIVKDKTNDVVYVLVERKSTKERGWVKKDSVILNPIAKATLLNPSQVYKINNELSRDFFNMSAPMIGYVVELKEDWARVKWYMSAYKVFTGKSEWTSYEWIKLSAISTNSQDADLLAFAYGSFYRLAKWQSEWPALDEKKRNVVSNDIEKEIIVLQNALNKYSKAASAQYVNSILESLQNLIYPVQSKPSEEPQNYEDEEPEAGEAD